MGILKEVKEKKSKKRLWKISLALIILIGLAYGAYIKFWSWTPLETTKIATVTQQDLASSLSTDGKVFFKEAYDLSFQSSGILKHLAVKEGDQISTGELIASLDTTYLKIDLDKTKIALKTAQANLDAKLASRATKTEVNISEKQLSSAQTSLETSLKESSEALKNAQISFEWSQKSIENAKLSTSKDLKTAQETIATKQEALKNAQDNLQTTKQNESLNISNAQEKAQSEINITLPLLQKYLRNIDLILWVSLENKSNNDAYEIYLGAKDVSSKTLAESSYSVAMTGLDYFETSYQNLPKERAFEGVEKILEITSLVKDVLQNTRWVLKSTVESEHFSQSTIDSLIASLDADLSALEAENQKLILSNQAISSALLSFQTKEQSLQNTIDSLTLEITQSQTSLEKTQAQIQSSLDTEQLKYDQALQAVNAAQTKQQNSLDLAKSQVEVSKATLQNTQSPYDNRELSPYYTAIENAKKTIQEAQERLNDASIISPIRGTVVTLLSTKIGSTITPNSQTPFVTIVDPSSLKIKAQVEEGDIPYITLGQKVKITYNSLENITSTGTVDFISDKAVIDANGIVTYRVEITFDALKEPIKDGFTTQISFLLKEVPQALVLPSECIHTTDEISSVTLPDGSTKEVKIGINDGDFTQILSWLSLGDKVVY